MREYPAKIRLLEERAILRVTSLERLPQEWRPDLRFLVSVENDDDLISFYRLLKNEISNIALLTHNSNVFESQDISSIKISADSLMRGDVISVLPCQQHIQVLIRDTDIHHTVFLTNRCNSNCLMCSQPPTRSDDSWLIEEAKRVADHISTSPITIGFTGGNHCCWMSALEKFSIISHPFILVRNSRFSRTDAVFLIQSWPLLYSQTYSHRLAGWFHCMDIQISFTTSWFNPQELSGKRLRDC